MQLNQIRIPLRARKPWSAVDLGCTLARHWWMPLFLVWLVPSLLLYCLLLFIFPDLPWVSLLVVWWLKPYWDQLSLHMGSRLILGEPVNVVQTWRSGFSIVRKDWWQWISIRRLSATRSFDMPMTTLEQVGGKVRIDRKRVLHQSATSAPFWLTILTLHLEYILVYGLLALFYLMLPEHVSLNWAGMFVAESSWVSVISNSLFCLSMAMLAPFYTMSGFVLYLNRRIELEGWDIELQFRQLANQSKSRNKPVHQLVSALLIFFCVSIAVLAPDAAIANDHPYRASSLDLSESKNIAEEVLEGESFHQEETIRHWRRKNIEEEEEENKEVPEWLISFVKLIEHISKAIAGLGVVVEVLFWTVFASLIIYLIYRYRKELVGTLGIFRKKPKEKQIPKVLFGLDVREEQLPQDIVGEAKALWEADNKRDAIALLYRASLSKLIRDYDCPFHDSDTESECVRKVEHLGVTPITGFIILLTESWQRIAYGHLDIPPDRFSTLCEQWKQVLS